MADPASRVIRNRQQFTKAATAPRSKVVRTHGGTRLLRLIRLALHIGRAVAAGALVFPFLDRAGCADYAKQWSARLLAILAVRLEISGTPPVTSAPATMIIANHVSWLDIFAINATHAVRFVAKSEIRRWPLFGWVCERVGTVFIHRRRRHHIAQVNREVVSALRRGELFAVFPEGKITTGDKLLPFNSALLQPALTCDAALCPVAIRYTRVDGSLCSEADYEGDKSMLDSLLLMVTQPAIYVRLHFLPPLDCAGKHRRALAQEAAQLIANSLGVAAPGTRAGTTSGRKA